MSKHTPGPWHAKNLHVYSGSDHSDDGIRDNAITQGGCGCCNSWDDGVHKIEDARLIAAAPELMEALENLLALTNSLAPEAEAARAAIKKAKGEA